MVSEEENCRLVHGGLYQMVEWMQCNALRLILLEGGDRTNLESNFMTNLLFVISFLRRTNTVEYYTLSCHIDSIRR